MTLLNSKSSVALISKLRSVFLACRMNRRGQAGISSILYLAVAGIVLSILTPQIIYYTEYAQNASGAFPLAQMLIGLTPFFMWIVWIVSAIKVTTPYRERIMGEV